MKITRVSAWSKKETTLDLPVTEEQLERYHNREDLVQNIFPNLTPGQREFIMTRYTEEDWAEMFPPEEEE